MSVILNIINSSNPVFNYSEDQKIIIKKYLKKSEYLVKIKDLPFNIGGRHVNLAINDYYGNSYTHVDLIKFVNNIGNNDYLYNDVYHIFLPPKDVIENVLRMIKPVK